MADTDLALLLDADSTGNGIRIITRTGGATDTLSHYYVVPSQGYAGHARWVSVTRTDTDADKNTAIRAALA